MNSKCIWFVRAGRRAAYVDDFISNGVVAIGWEEAGEFDHNTDDEEIARLFKQCYPKERDGTLFVWIAQVRRFLRKLQVGDEVMTYDPNQRVYFLGTVKSEAQ